MATDLQTSPRIHTAGTSTGSTKRAADGHAESPAAVRASWLTSLRAAIATRRADRSTLSRQIAAYPATRSAAAIVVPTINR